MKYGLLCSIGLFALLGINEARAAGDVIRVGASGGLFTVAGGRTDIAGFAHRVLFEDDADGYPVATHVSGFGTSYLWTNPGVRLDGLLTNSGLYLEALVRPVGGSSPPRERALWYWNPANGQIEDVPEDNHFLIYKGFAAQSIFLYGTTSEPEPPVRIAGPVAADMGYDSYGGFLRFALHRIVEPPVGVYGVFARFTSDFYPASDPFLILFNHGQLSGAQMLAGAMAINASADEASDLPGDFNSDGQVDAADYTVWRSGLGGQYDQSDYVNWKTHFGQTAGSGSLGIVPEPAGMALCIVALGACLPFRLRRMRGLAP